MEHNHTVEDSQIFNKDCYSTIRDCLENEEELKLPFRAVYSTNHELKRLLKEEPKFSWREEHGEYVITVRSHIEAEDFVDFAENMDFYYSSKKAEKLLAARDKTIKTNRWRKLFFLSLLPIDYEGVTQDQLTRELMHK